MRSWGVTNVPDENMALTGRRQSRSIGARVWLKSNRWSAHACANQEARGLATAVAGEYKMKNQDKPRRKLTTELEAFPVLRQRTRELESPERDRKRAEEALRRERDKAQMYLDVAGVAIVVIDADEKASLVNRRGCEVLGYSQEELIGRNWFDVCVPASIREDMRRLFRRLVSGEVEPTDYYESQVLTRQGDEKVMGWYGTRVTDEAGNCTGMLASGEDVTERKRAEKNILQRNRVLLALYNVLTSMTQTMEVNEVLREIVTQAGVALSSAYTCIMMMQEDGKLEVCGEDCRNMPALPISAHLYEVAGSIIASGEPLVVGDTETAQDTPPALVNAGIKSYVGMPIKTKDSTVGAMLVHSVRRNAFADSIRLVAVFANQAAIAIENAQLYQVLTAERLQVEKLLSEVLTAQEDERRRVSLDLHDTITQSMYGVLAYVGAADALLSKSRQGEARADLAHAKEALEQTLVDLRRLATDLHPPALERMGLAEALRQHVGKFSRSNKTTACSFNVQGTSRRLVPAVEIAAYRIVQEALNNARRHAAATELAVQLQFLPEGIELEVSDNGKGFDFSKGIASKTIDGHLGLAGMMERAELLGGSLKVQTSPGTGTRLVISIPRMSPAGKSSGDGGQHATARRSAGGTIGAEKDPSPFG